MSFDQIWQQLVRKKPELVKNDSTVTFTAANLRQLLRQVYEQGQKTTEPKPNPFTDIFKGL